MKPSPYPRLLLMVLLSFLSMYVLMYAMVDRLANVYPSLNQTYMAALMAAPMLVIELALMRRMYPEWKLNVVLLLLGVVALGGFWTLIRRQTAIDDRQFLRSMIPHHGGAILMCQQASLRDPEVKTLCERIVAGQKAEIAQMKRLLEGRGARIVP